MRAPYLGLPMHTRVAGQILRIEGEPSFGGQRIRGRFCLHQRRVSPPWMKLERSVARKIMASPSQSRRHPPSTPHRPGRRDWGWHHLITAVSSTRLLIGEAARIVNFAIVEEISPVLSQMRTEAAR